MRGRPLLERFWSYVVKGSGDECWLWSSGHTTAGYGTIGAGGRAGKNLYAHRLSWELHNGPLPEGAHVCHRCDNPGCCNPAHLFLGSPAANTADKVSKGRHARGEGHGNAKLTLQQVGDIRRIYATGGFTQYQLADAFGVSRGCIEHIVLGSTWKAA